jgi:hypothetical protein
LCVPATQLPCTHGSTICGNQRISWAASASLRAVV